MLKHRILCFLELLKERIDGCYVVQTLRPRYCVWRWVVLPRGKKRRAAMLKRIKRRNKQALADAGYRFLERNRA